MENAPGGKDCHALGYYLPPTAYQRLSAARHGHVNVAELWVPAHNPVTGTALRVAEGKNPVGLEERALKGVQCPLDGAPSLSFHLEVV